MRFAPLVSILSAVCFVLAQSPTVTIGIIQGVTQKSSDLTQLVQTINVVNFVFVAPQIGAGLSDIANDVFNAISNMQSPPPVYNDADASAVVQVLTTFVRVHQILLNTIIGKYGLLALVPPPFSLITEPVRVALVTIESAVDAFAFALIAMIPTKAPQAQTQFDSLAVTVDGAIKVYSGPC